MAQIGSLIVVSGPSGSGKSTLTMAVINEVPNLKFSVSHTTRPPRPREIHGKNYFFVKESEFNAMRQQDQFFEWATVYGNLYGTSKKFIMDSLSRGEDVLLDIDVQGARTVKKQWPAAILVFILPPSYDILRKRLEDRGLDAKENIAQRLNIAREQEISQYREYDYLIVNADMETAKQELKSIIFASRCRRSSRDGLAQKIIQTFN